MKGNHPFCQWFAQLASSATLGFDGCRVGLLNEKNDSSLVLFGDLDLVASLPDEVWDINNGQRVSAVHRKNVARRYRRERLARLERGYRTTETSKIQFDSGHVLELTTVRRSQG